MVQPILGESNGVDDRRAGYIIQTHDIYFPNIILFALSLCSVYVRGGTAVTDGNYCYNQKSKYVYNTHTHYRHMRCCCCCS